MPGPLVREDGAADVREPAAAGGPGTGRSGGRSGVLADVAASLVVFLVALPLCLGVAIASGVPPELGLITGIVGGVVAGAMPGSSLIVSGPAAGLTVLVFDVVREHGLVALGPVVLLAGAIQVVLGLRASATGSAPSRCPSCTGCSPASA